MMLAPSGALAQSGNGSTGATGSTGAAFGGAALGAVSGSMLALTGGLGACNRTLYPSRCSRITVVTGAVVGLAAGAFIGWNDRSGLDDRLENAAWGTLVGAAVLAPYGALSQNGQGSTCAALGGAALGAVSGSMLALSGGLGACNRTLYPTRCSRITTATGAVIGLVTGAVIGWENRSALDDRVENAAYGTLVGAAGGVVMKLGLQHYGWPDVAAVSAVGLAVGASIEGAGIGLAVGTVTGLALWGLHPSVGPGGAVAWGLAGMAVGGLADWVAGAVRSGSDMNGIPMQFSVSW